MKRHRPLIKILLSLTALFAVHTSATAQDDKKIQPGVQWDTATVVKPVRYPEHLIGIRYDYSFTGVMTTPKMHIKGLDSPLNFAILYTYYNPLWSAYDFFGLQTGFRYSKYGFRNDRYQFERFEQMVTTVELPLLSAFHINIGEHFRVLLSIGPFAGYRILTTKENGFDCFDNRFDYGLIGGVGFAFRLGRIVELHLEGSFHYSLALLYHPEKMSSDWWLYSYPWQASISFGVHFKLK